MSLSHLSDDALGKRLSDCDAFEQEIDDAYMGLDYASDGIDKEDLTSAIRALKSLVSDLDCDIAKEEESRRTKASEVKKVLEKHDELREKQEKHEKTWEACFEEGCPFQAECAPQRSLFNFATSGAVADSDVAMRLCNEQRDKAENLGNGSKYRHASEFVQSFLRRKTDLDSASSSSEESSDDINGGGLFKRRSKRLTEEDREVMRMYEKQMREEKEMREQAKREYERRERFKRYSSLGGGDLARMKRSIHRLERASGKKQVGMRRVWNALASAQ